MMRSALIYADLTDLPQVEEIEVRVHNELYVDVVIVMDNNTLDSVASYSIVVCPATMSSPAYCDHTRIGKPTGLVTVMYPR